GKFLLHRDTWREDLRRHSRAFAPDRGLAEAGVLRNLKRGRLLGKSDGHQRHQHNRRQSSGLREHIHRAIPLRAQKTISRRPKKPARQPGYESSFEPGASNQARSRVMPMTAQGVRREKAALSSGCKAHPANRSSRKQPEQSWRQRNDLYELHRVKSFFALWLQTPT